MAATWASTYPPYCVAPRLSSAWVLPPWLAAAPVTVRSVSSVPAPGQYTWYFPPPRVVVKLTGSSPGARFSFSPRIRWSCSSSTSVIPVALWLVTVKVTGPAATESALSRHSSEPPSPESVMATRETPPDCSPVVSAEPDELLPQAASPRTAMALPMATGIRVALRTDMVFPF